MGIERGAGLSTVGKEYFPQILALYLAFIGDIFEFLASLFDVF